MIHIIRTPATRQQIEEMQQALETYIKLAVDIKLGILAGGGVMHADCESVLLENGSAQEDIWGADWNPTSQQVTFEALINIRPHQSNSSMEIIDPQRRDRVAQITRQLLEHS
jgi:RES domain-containing protein